MALAVVRRAFGVVSSKDDMVASWLEELREQEIVRRVLDDPRTKPGTRLGWPADRVMDDVLGWGQADFDAPVGDLNGADRALLYAFFNQPRHLREVRGALCALFESADRAGTPVILDLGCGPFTAGLALAAEIGSGRAFRYFGIDHSVEMCKLGGALAESARRRGALHASTTIAFGGELDDLDFGKSRSDLTLVIASYLLASPSIDVGALAASIVGAVDRRGPGTAAFLYLNSPKPRPNSKWPALRDALGAAGFELVLDEVEDVRCALLLRKAWVVRPIPGAP